MATIQRVVSSLVKTRQSTLLSSTTSLHRRPALTSAFHTQSSAPFTHHNVTKLAIAPYKSSSYGQTSRRQTSNASRMINRRHFSSQTTPNQPPPGPAGVESKANTQTIPEPSIQTTLNTAAPKPITTTTPTPPVAEPPYPVPVPPQNPTKTTPAPHKRSTGNDTIQMRSNYLDRRDNTHSYEKGQFQVATGNKLNEKNLNWLYYLTSIGFASLGMSFVAVPLYQAFCQLTGSGGQLRRDQQIDELNRYMQRTRDMGEITLRPIEVTFQSTVDVNLDWSFYPCQKDITLRIGETALAFFRARNNGDKAVIGVSTYNVLPPQAGLYFNKIQCFCFDEQRLRAGEEVDMPIFFFLDPAMADDWRMDNVDQVTLCYTFFEVQEDEVEEAVRGLNEVRSLHNERIASSGLSPMSLPTPAPTSTSTSSQQDERVPIQKVVDNGDGTKTISTTFTVHIPEGQISTNLRTANDDDEAMICPIIPPTAMHNPSGISLMQSQVPRIVSDAEALANEAKAKM